MQIINTIIQEFIAGNEAPCQSVQDYSQDDVTNDADFDSYDELLIIFGGYEETIMTDTIVDEPWRGKRRHRGPKGENRKRHSQRNKQRRDRRHHSDY